MKYKKFSLFGWRTSWLGLLNRTLLQWFFIRLQAQVEKNKDISEFHLIGFIVPTTGWTTKYKYVGKQFKLLLWKAK